MYITSTITIKNYKKINNVLSVRIGSILLLLSVLLITFGNFYMIMIGIILETIAFTFKDMINIILRNNLIYAFKSDEYIKYKNKSFLIYSIATAIIALVVGYLFNLNYYIPMICCTIIIMSLFIDDIKKENVEEKSNNSYSKIIIKNKMIINIILFFEGWWTLFIIVPTFIGLVAEKDKTGNIIGLIIGLFLLLACRRLFDFKLIWKLIFPLIFVIIGLSLIFKNNINKEVSEKNKN